MNSTEKTNGHSMADNESGECVENSNEEEHNHLNGSEETHEVLHGEVEENEVILSNGDDKEISPQTSEAIHSSNDLNSVDSVVEVLLPEETSAISSQQQQKQQEETSQVDGSTEGSSEVAEVATVHEKQIGDCIDELVEQIVVNLTSNSDETLPPTKGQGDAEVDRIIEIKPEQNCDAEE